MYSIVGAREGCILLTDRAFHISLEDKVYIYTRLDKPNMLSYIFILSFLTSEIGPISLLYKSWMEG